VSSICSSLIAMRPRRSQVKWQCEAGPSAPLISPVRPARKCRSGTHRVLRASLSYCIQAAPCFSHRDEWKTRRERVDSSPSAMAKRRTIAATDIRSRQRCTAPADRRSDGSPCPATGVFAGQTDPADEDPLRDLPGSLRRAPTRMAAEAQVTRNSTASLAVPVTLIVCPPRSIARNRE